MFLLDETKHEVILILLLDPVYTEQKSFPTLGKNKQADTNTFKGWPRRGMPVVKVLDVTGNLMLCVLYVYNTLWTISCEPQRVSSCENINWKHSDVFFPFKFQYKQTNFLKTLDIDPIYTGKHNFYITMIQ